MARKQSAWKYRTGESPKVGDLLMCEQRMCALSHDTLYEVVRANRNRDGEIFIFVKDDRYSDDNGGYYPSRFHRIGEV